MTSSPALGLTILSDATVIAALRDALDVAVRDRNRLEVELREAKASEAEAWAKRRLYFSERNEEARTLINLLSYWASKAIQSDAPENSLLVRARAFLAREGHR